MGFGFSPDSFLCGPNFALFLIVPGFIIKPNTSIQQRMFRNNKMFGNYLTV